jgi:3-hydroxyisobutyrate dehydrogenase
MEQRATSLAVLGLGTMGQGMARSALRAGVSTVVWDRNLEVARPFADRGATVAPTAAAAVQAVDVAITMVTDANAVMSIATDLGMLAALPEGAVWAQMSTIGVEATEAIASMVDKQRPDISFLDAPVAGSKVPADQGRLTIFASGPETARPKVEAVFSAIGERTVWVGPVGTGSRMKLVNNTLLAFSAEGVASSLALAHRLGLATQSVLDAFKGAPLVSSWDAGKIQRIAAEDYSAEFPLRLALKDVHLALEHADPERFVVLASLAKEWEHRRGKDLANRTSRSSLASSRAERKPHSTPFPRRGPSPSTIVVSVPATSRVPTRSPRRVAPTESERARAKAISARGSPSSRALGRRSRALRDGHPGETETRRRRRREKHAEASAEGTLAVLRHRGDPTAEVSRAADCAERVFLRTCAGPPHSQL